jgi:deoxyribodipyrimidine photo-lyase
VTVALWWLRRDLRLGDNHALAAALAHAEGVVPVFVLDPFLLEGSPYVGEKRLAFLFAGLRALDDDLRERGGRLVVRRGRPVDVLAGLLDDVGADAVFAQADVSPYAQRRDGAVAAALPLRLTGGLTARPVDAVRKSDGGFYVAYAYYKQGWRALAPVLSEELLPPPENLGTPEVDGVGVPDEPVPPADPPFPAGEGEARRRLASFVEEGLADYARSRDRLDGDVTSRLSPYLRFGMLSPREAVAAALATGEGEGARVWVDELIWREFFAGLLAHFPVVRETDYREKYRDLAWENDEGAFTAWQEGRTGYPVVDAAMRQLRETGWIHNRARMIVASFLTKDLLVDWRWGERHFMRHLLDGDPAANNGNWQWVAGTGAEAQPYFRVFNPVSQGEEHDPRGAFVRRRIPELAEVPDEYVHRPWEMPRELQEEVGCVIGEDYPAPIVDHGEARERALAAYKAAGRD